MFPRWPRRERKPGMYLMKIRRNSWTGEVANALAELRGQRNSQGEARFRTGPRLGLPR